MSPVAVEPVRDTLNQIVYGATQKPKTFKQWEDIAKDATKEIMIHGSPSPLVWVHVTGKAVPGNAIVAGEEHGHPLFIARTFYEVCIGKAGRHLERGAAFPYNGREIQTDSYEVLVPALQPLRYQVSETLRMKSIPRISGAIEVRGNSMIHSFTYNAISSLKSVVLVDDSSSMYGRLWPAAREALAGVVEVNSKYSTEGVDVYFMNNTRSELNLKSGTAVRQLFNSVIPQGETPTGARLEDLFKIYLPLIENPKSTYRPITLIVITDGEPTDDPKGVIASAARRLDQQKVPFGRFGIQFVQIGDDPDAAEALRELDDDIEAEYGVRDMVDSTRYHPSNPEFTVDTMTKVLFGAIDTHLDESGSVRAIPRM
ncbi:hypothetical protein AMATHDRAFT_146821 [Amanita thiersii Skay4041]|uniref:VWFA domain-containing protein n=1 Tax=Amanita thiersii Skay4041 TaxID=703135 RepID=A0A2A9NI96_9AGAR|nr:hypothetical protein AMATHDRAFT_146821 [Amanita thiersii Skay4041]